MSTTQPTRRTTRAKPAEGGPRPPRSVAEWTVFNLNNDLITMIIIAWDAGVTGANMAIVDRADACGFDMRAVDRHGRSQHRRITFRSAPCATVEKVRRELADLRERAARPRLAVSPSLFASLFAWCVLAFAWGHTHGVHVLEERVARFVGLHEEDVPSSKEFLGWCTFAVLAANAVEGLAAVYLARTKFLFSRRNCLGWFLLSLVAGRAAHREVFFSGAAAARAPDAAVGFRTGRGLPGRPGHARAEAGAVARVHGRVSAEAGLKTVRFSCLGSPS